MVSIDREEALRRAHEITLEIRALRGRRIAHGSAVVMAEDGLALTARHVVAGASRITARFTNGKIVPVKVLCVDKEWDLAAIQCLVTEPVLHGYVSGKMPDMFERDYLMIGNPGGRGKTVKPARLSRSERVTVSWFGTKQALATIEGPCEPGFSGGGFFDRDTGTLRGVIVAMSTSRAGRGFVVPTSDYLRFGAHHFDFATHPVMYATLRCWHALGIWAAPIPLKEAKYRQGLFLTHVQPNSQADRLGWQVGDIMLGLQRYKTEYKDHVIYVLDQVHKAEEETTAILARDGKVFRSTVKLPPAEKFDRRRIGDLVERKLAAYDEYRGTLSAPGGGRRG